MDTFGAERPDRKPADGLFPAPEPEDEAPEAEVPEETDSEQEAPEEEPEGASPAEEEERPAPAAAKASGGTGKGWLSDPEKTRQLLATIQEIDREGPYPQDRFSELLALRLGWTTATRYEVGGIFTALVRKNLIVRKFRGSRPFGYELSQEGHELLASLAPPPPPPAPAAAAPPAADPFEVIRSVGSVAQRFLDANVRLQQIEARERELAEEMEMLRDERADICAFLEDPAIQKVLSTLGQLTLARR